MSHNLPSALVASAVAVLALCPSAAAQELPAPGVPTTTESAELGPLTRAGETLPASAIGPIVIEDMAAVLEREAKNGPDGTSPKARNGAQGEWEVPSLRSTKSAHSGIKHLINRWGDTQMGVGFGGQVDLDGAWLAGQGTLGSWTSGVQAVGYRDGVEVGRTAWFESIGAEPTWFAIDLDDIDRVEFVARPVIEGAGGTVGSILRSKALERRRLPALSMDRTHHFRATFSGRGAGLRSGSRAALKLPSPPTWLRLAITWPPVSVYSSPKLTSVEKTSW